MNLGASTPCPNVKPPLASTKLLYCYEIQYTWTARSTETETETGLDGYVMLGTRWLTEY